MSENLSERAALLFWCPNALGVTSLLEQFFADKNVMPIELLSYTDAGCCFIRVEWLGVAAWNDELEFEAELAIHAEGLDAHFTVKFFKNTPTIGVFCSQQVHVLNDLLSNVEASYYPKIEIPFIFSDNDSCRKVADRYGIPFFYISPSAAGDAVQAKQIEIVRRYNTDWLVLPRYDALLSQSVASAAKCPILTVQNSFLPSVKSEKAFEMAYEQGLKVLGATARLLESKKAGPIVEQGVVELGPCPTAISVQECGHNVERKVFANALRKLVEHKVIVYNARTIVFD